MFAKEECFNSMVSVQINNEYSDNYYHLYFLIVALNQMLRVLIRTASVRHYVLVQNLTLLISKLSPYLSEAVQIDLQAQFY